MRYLKADRIFDVSGRFKEKLVLILDHRGEVYDIVPEREVSEEKIEHHKGWLVPGFVNAHCHLELSHLKDVIAQKEGLGSFIQSVQRNRQHEEEIRTEAIRRADQELKREGVVLVGDICNDDSSFQIKNESSIEYYNFIELFGFDPNNAEDRLNYGRSLLSKWNGMNPGNRGSLVPHAPYSVSRKLFQKIGQECYLDGSIVSMHNQETASENEFYLKGSGELKDKLESLGVDFGDWKGTGFRSTASVAHEIQRCNDLLLVHNTFSEAQDIDWVLNYTDRSWWCTCPKANLYIEDRIPDYRFWLEKGLRIVVGTDSLASNNRLSIVDELNTIKMNAPFLEMEELLKWATINGADLFGKKNLGRFEKGSKPGVNLIQLNDGLISSLEALH